MYENCLIQQVNIDDDIWDALIRKLDDETKHKYPNTNFAVDVKQTQH